MLIHLVTFATLCLGGVEVRATFEAPVRLMAGEQTMGHKRLYPSPVMHDVDGDKKPEMLIGDLWGKLTVSKREKDSWSAPEPLNGADGKPLRFNNW